ncbi:putative GTP diphosphokinase [Helianthus annuus]|uniref:Putative GTP diphosphokinase RSH1, chloroplastic n=1 Tax=Helianthus annuus TaxID=4232 RepID=A0A251S4V1_HELAN|nr:putative GTP diphosphokinase RSH1, chloroplastic isoform X2 [Helianthus annuus]KAF5762815.1 putative GTP diphosphokinase [Helianthus annuus]KAJ0449826.1 putative GTP diphosphokinase [Helianthus annuus]KAJ0471527.1 putative GTP diphosphokinase [Helianthus annuus]KAJ0647154.1 putative GTP diphosphokinase [Helianthus annuus]KAJ0842902.1 putative GTP diphosphokinase [Helianthus annuus]
MASAPFLSVSLECVSVCKYPKADGSGSGSGRYDCSSVTCAWKAPRVLTGSLASTANGQSERRIRHAHRCEASDRLSSRRPVRSKLLHLACKKWEVGSSSSSFSSGYDEVSPEHLWEDLKPAIAYLASDELKLVRDALHLAFEAHNGQKRRSGEPFIIHPVEVAKILGELELDWESIAAGLLHDTVEDTNLVTFEEIEIKFGAAVRHIVEGETKVSKLGKLKYKNESRSIQDVKAHDLRQMFLAMTEEVRVIIVKLADRLHNMRTLSHMPSHKQYSIAMETLQVFAPLAKLLGMYQIKSELENLSFMYTNPQDYATVKRRVAELCKEQEKEIEEANKILIKKIEEDQFLDLMTVKTEVLSVCKEPYSIHKSVVKSKGSINEVNQIAQLRIIVKPKSCVGVGPLCNAQQICYHVLGLVHGIWTPVPRSMKDYIATPKPNGYQSLHTTVIPFLYESMFRLEVQIRTEEMNLIAERGIAAHYSGKIVVNGLVRDTMANDRNSRGKPVCLNNTNVALRIGWLNAIREWQEEFVGHMSCREFVDTITKDLLGSRVFVFTPRGEIKNLPKGATVIDYAYMIHTDIGNSMVAAKVNGNIVPPLHVLANAEVVEIVTYNALSSKSAFQRHKQWLQHAKTRSARHKIMKFLKEQAAQSAAELTAESVNEFLADSGDDSETEEVTDYSKGTQHTWEKILMNVMEMSSMKIIGQDIFQFKNGSGIKVPKVNGKHNKNMKNTSLTKSKEDPLSQGNGVAKMIFADVPMYKEVLPGLESWRDGKVSSWSDFEGHSIQWMCVVCIDRRGMLADITKTLADVGVTICSCAAEVIKEKGMAVILFHVESSLDDMVSACSRVDMVIGVLGWSTGCSVPGLTESRHVQEC